MRSDFFTWSAGGQTDGEFFRFLPQLWQKLMLVSGHSGYTLIERIIPGKVLVHYFEIWKRLL